MQTASGMVVFGGDAYPSRAKHRYESDLWLLEQRSLKWRRAWTDPEGALPAGPAPRRAHSTVLYTVRLLKSQGDLLHTQMTCLQPDANGLGGRWGCRQLSHASRWQGRGSPMFELQRVKPGVCALPANSTPRQLALPGCMQLTRSLSAVQDPASGEDRMVVFGGRRHDGVLLSDSWEATLRWPNVTWHLVRRGAEEDPQGGSTASGAGLAEGEAASAGEDDEGGKKKKGAVPPARKGHIAVLVDDGEVPQMVSAASESRGAIQCCHSRTILVVEGCSWMQVHAAGRALGRSETMLRSGWGTGLSVLVATALLLLRALSWPCNCSCPPLTRVKILA